MDNTANRGLMLSPEWIANPKKMNGAEIPPRSISPKNNKKGRRTPPNLEKLGRAKSSPELINNETSNDVFKQIREKTTFDRNFPSLATVGTTRKRPQSPLQLTSSISPALVDKSGSCPATPTNANTSRKAWTKEGSTPESIIQSSKKPESPSNRDKHHRKAASEPTLTERILQEKEEEQRMQLLPRPNRSEGKITEEESDNALTKRVDIEAKEEKFLRNMGWLPDDECHVPELTVDEINDTISSSLEDCTN
ncbi:hypothetical protein PROFUN_01451 [Planoprotostelium fungivorum]|uniref:Uncharacterized protein n=1 Tax=Planoprotostelium fungivorum TaxID=1890364 RepID=A0A2P6NT86_9EUKA|nr:hypothetical protein PROFUN_01451 [Planoprotostelium fungivorum]